MVAIVHSAAGGRAAVSGAADPLEIAIDSIHGRNFGFDLMNARDQQSSRRAAVRQAATRGPGGRGRSPAPVITEELGRRGQKAEWGENVEICCGRVVIEIRAGADPLGLLDELNGAQVASSGETK
ncbi:hypothetical protein EVAR_19464_1 [Eumeta japonica]|uniref:Uncharacterized protein n=1 Tax=Eumeta variegata TaxID=151549 RepID=A0A4C1VBB0_EUMVA|nr:hypothetical protein EVAR_19464_1 [Eumeta japonica]